MNKNKRPQTPKDRLNARTRAVVDRAGSNAAGPHPSAAKYNRKDKHKGKRDW